MEINEDRSLIREEYNKLIKEVIEKNNRAYIAVLKNIDNLCLRNYIEQFGQLKKETIYLILNDFQRKKCEICENIVKIFSRIKTGYIKTCSYECKIKYGTSQLNYKEIRRKQQETINKNPELKKSIIDKRVATMRKNGHYDNLKCLIKEQWKRGDFEINRLTMNERYGHETAKIMKNKIAETTHITMTKKDEDGVSLAEKNNRKRVITMKSNIDENGLNGIQRANKKAHETKTNNIDENGLTTHQRAHAKSMYVAKNTYNENGISNWEMKNHRNSISLKNKYNKFVEDKNINVYLYIFKVDTILKIGWSSNYKIRHKEIQNGLGKGIDIVRIIKGKYKSIRELELFLHKDLDDYNINIKYLKPKNIRHIGKTEWFRSECLIKLTEHLNNFESKGTINGN